MVSVYVLYLFTLWGSLFLGPNTLPICLLSILLLSSPFRRTSFSISFSLSSDCVSSSSLSFGDSGGGLDLSH